MSGIDFGGEPVVFNPKKRKSRRKGFDPLRVFTLPFAGLDSSPITSAEGDLLRQIKKDRALMEGTRIVMGAAPRPPKGAK